jgi:hypothetical protein
MVHRRTRKMRGGSIPSDNVMAFAPTACMAPQPFFDAHPTGVPYPVDAQPFFDAQPAAIATPSYIAAGGGRRPSLNERRSALDARAKQLQVRMQHLNEREGVLNHREHEIDHQLGGGSCANNTVPSQPYNYDAFSRFRGSIAGSYATVPTNAYQKLNNWFQGETTLMVPSENSAMNQNRPLYFTHAADMQAVGGNVPDLTSATFTAGDGMSRNIFADRQPDPQKFNMKFSRTGAGGAQRRRASMQRRRRSPKTRRA